MASILRCIFVNYLLFSVTCGRSGAIIDDIKALQERVDELMVAQIMIWDRLRILEEKVGDL